MKRKIELEIETCKDCTPYCRHEVEEGGSGYICTHPESTVGGIVSDWQLNKNKDIWPGIPDVCPLEKCDDNMEVMRKRSRSPQLILHKERMQEYFTTARERYEILLRRRQNLSIPPYSTDPIFQEWRFCNVFREDDRTTIWIREHVREPLYNDPRVLLAMVTCRLFNKIETLNILNENGLFTDWNSDIARELLKDAHPLISPAYMIQSPENMNKLDGILWTIDNIAKGIATLHLCDITSLEGLWNKLIPYSGIGGFLAYEIVSDMRWTDYFKEAPDIMTWANAGPGACIGLSWIHEKDVIGIRATNKHVMPALGTILSLSQDPNNWPVEWPKWEMREVEHWLCEYGKYIKVKYLGERMKRRFE